MSLRFGMPLAAVALALSAGSARAIFVLADGGQVNLSAVMDSNDRQFQVGDKLFTVLSYTSAAVPSAAVNITGFISATPTDGIGFDLTGGFGDVPGDGTLTDMNLHYTVEVVDPGLSQGMRIKDTGLVFNGSAVGAGSFARVDESILDAAGVPGTNLVGTRQVWFNAGSPPDSRMQDFQVFANGANYLKLEIDKDIQFFAVGPNSQAAASFIRQSFSQTPTPGGAALSVMAGLILARRRR